jgi:hypothetical protein
MPFNLTTLTLRGELSSQSGSTISESGPVVDFAFDTSWRGYPLAPGASQFEVVTLQDRWGEFDSTTRYLYGSRRIPPGGCQLRARFLWNPHPVLSGEAYQVRAVPTAFSIRRRTVAEDGVFARVAALAAMPWDSSVRPAFLDSLMAFLAESPSSRPQASFLPYVSWGEVTAAIAIGLSPSPQVMDTVNRVRLSLADSNRFIPAGAIAVMGVWTDSPRPLPGMSQVLGESLAGSVASFLLSKPPTP